MAETNSSLKDFNTHAKRQGAELRFQHDIIGIPNNKKELAAIAKKVEQGGPSLSNGYQREMVSTVQSLEELNLPGKEFASAVQKQLQEVSAIYKRNPASDDDTPEEQSALESIRTELSTYAAKRSTIGGRARSSVGGVAQKVRQSAANQLSGTNILGTALSALIRPRGNKKTERQRGVAAAAMSSSQSAFGVHSPRKAGGDDDEWGGGDFDLGGEGGLGGGGGGLGGGEVLVRLVNIEDILHEIWQLADAADKRGDEAAKDDAQAKEARERAGERPDSKESSPTRVDKEDADKEDDPKSWLGMLGGILTSVLSAVTGMLFTGGIGGLMKKVFTTALRTLVRSPILKILTSIGRVITFLMGGGLLAIFAVVMTGWLASVALIVSIALRNEKLKKAYEDEAFNRMTRDEATAAGIPLQDEFVGDKPMEALAMETADALQASEGDTDDFRLAMERADLDADKIKERGFTAEEAVKLFGGRAAIRGENQIMEAGKNRQSTSGWDQAARPDPVDRAEARRANTTETLSKGTMNTRGVREKPFESTGGDTGIDIHDEGRLTTSPTRARVGTETEERIKRHEGTGAMVGDKYQPYADADGYSVGFGHYLGTNLKPEQINRLYSQEEVDDFFADDFASHAAAARRIPGFAQLGADGQSAMEELTYNMGKSWFETWPDLLEILQEQEGDWQGAAADNLQFQSDWGTQVSAGRAQTVTDLLRNDTGSSSMKPPLAASNSWMSTPPVRLDDVGPAPLARPVPGLLRARSAGGMESPGQQGTGAEGVHAAIRTGDTIVHNNFHPSAPVEARDMSLQGVVLNT